jgi:hypothetical protein
MAAHWSTVLAVISTRAFDGDVLQDEDVHPRMVTPRRPSEQALANFLP